MIESSVETLVCRPFWGADLDNHFQILLFDSDVTVLNEIPQIIGNDVARFPAYLSRTEVGNACLNFSHSALYYPESICPWQRFQWVRSHVRNQTVAEIHHSFCRNWNRD